MTQRERASPFPVQQLEQLPDLFQVHVGRLVLEEIEQVTGTPIDVVHVIGGGAQNDFLCRLTANISRHPVLAGPVEAAALGNIRVQLHALGQVASLSEMRELVRASAEIRVHEPDAELDRWEALYDRFVRIVQPGLVEQGVAR